MLPWFSRMLPKRPHAYNSGFTHRTSLRSVLGAWSIHNAVTSVAEDQRRNRRAFAGLSLRPTLRVGHVSCLRNCRALAAGS